MFEFWRQNHRLDETIFILKTNPFFILGYGTPTCDCDDIHMDRFEKPPCTLYSLKASYVMVIFRSYDLLTVCSDIYLFLLSTIIKLNVMITDKLFGDKMKKKAYWSKKKFSSPKLNYR